MMSRIIKLIGSIVFHVVHLIWELIAKAIGLAAQPPLIILYYHNIRKEQRARFAWQMDALIRCGMPVLAGTDHATSVAKRLVAVTFDDGFVSAVQNALPVLLERKIPVTIFVSTACIGQPCSWIVNEGDPDHKELILSSEEIRNLSEQGVVIGSHSVSHRPLTTLSEREAFREYGLKKSQHSTDAFNPMKLEFSPAKIISLSCKLASKLKEYGFVTPDCPKEIINRIYDLVVQPMGVITHADKMPKASDIEFFFYPRNREWDVLRRFETTKGLTRRNGISSLKRFYQTYPSRFQNK